MASFDAHFTIDAESVPTFTCTPVGTKVVISYFNEGGANVILRIDPLGKSAPSTDSGRTNSSDPEDIDPAHRPILRNKLLRLRKGTPSRTYTTSNASPPPFTPTEKVFAFYDQKIKALFPLHQLVQQEKVKIDASFVELCNNLLDSLEAINLRKKNRVGWHITKYDGYGLLMTSMSPIANSSELLEFKPKWLAQSPTAPPDSRRCRTCALSAFRKKFDLSSKFCPLSLLSSDPLPRTILPPWKVDETSSPLGRALSQFFRQGEGHNLLKLLYQHQKKFDPSGVAVLCEPTSNSNCNSKQGKEARPRPSTPTTSIENLSLAMTLRDCTLFTTIARRPRGEKREGGEDDFVIETRLADLDPKSGDDAERLGKWYWDEMKLIEEGWYTGTEKLDEGVEQHQSCSLWR